MIAAEVFSKTKKVINLPDQGYVDFILNSADIIDQMRKHTNWREALIEIEGIPEEELYGMGLISSLKNWVDSSYPDIDGYTNGFKQTFRSAFRMLGAKKVYRPDLYTHRQILATKQGRAYTQEKVAGHRHNLSAGFKIVV
jgi:hypothetical protein